MNVKAHNEPLQRGSPPPTPAARLGPTSTLTRFFSLMSLHVCVLDFLLTRISGRIPLRQRVRFKCHGRS